MEIFGILWENCILDFILSVCFIEVVYDLQCIEKEKKILYNKLYIKD